MESDRFKSKGFASCPNCEANPTREIIQKLIRLKINSSILTAQKEVADHLCPTGTRSFVTDATATTFASTVVGLGANKVPVCNNGTNWVIG
jgi:hypothetical protein